MTYSQNGFENRLRNVQRTRVRMAHGYTSKVGADGLIVFRPKRRKLAFPWRGFALLIVGVFIFKGLIIAQSGEDAYAARLAALQTGTTLEQAGAVMMQSDPVSKAIAGKLAPLFW